MKITRLAPDDSGLVDWPTLSTHKRTVMTIGVFDGMHKGHQALIRRVVELAKQNDSLAVVMVLDSRPALAHTYADEHDGMDVPEDYVDTQALSSVDQRIRVMRDLGVDRVLVLHYTMAFAAKSFRFFLGQMVGKLGMRTLVLGKDAALGANRAGDVKAIQELSEATGVFELDVVDDLGPGYTWIPSHFEPAVPEDAGEPEDPREGLSKTELRSWTKQNNCRKVRVWSSSNVRYLLSRGCVQAAAEILGHDHAIEGEVVHGEQRGREIGFPTANLAQVVEGYVPVDGVYAGWLIDLGPVDGETDEAVGDRDKSTKLATSSDVMRMAEGSPWRWPAAISIGTKPTYSEETGIEERVIEPYAVTKDWLELYGHRIRVEFAGFLRRQIKFKNTDELKVALQSYADQTLEMTSGK